MEDITLILLEPLSSHVARRRQDERCYSEKGKGEDQGLWQRRKRMTWTS
jgi:hypothetical protein